MLQYVARLARDQFGACGQQAFAWVIAPIDTHGAHSGIYCHFDIEHGIADHYRARRVCAGFEECDFGHRGAGVAGNGGSAADAQHLAAELSGRFYYDRPPLFSEALHVNTSYITAVANDYSYDIIYSRLVEAMGKKGDILIGLSTSGNSANVIKALEKANEMGITTIAFTGKTGGKMNGIGKYLLNIPSTDTPRIQECHMLLGHTICELVEMNLFPKK